METFYQFCELSPHGGAWLVRLITKKRHGAERDGEVGRLTVDIGDIPQRWQLIVGQAGHYSAHIFIRPEQQSLGGVEYRMILVDLDHTLEPRHRIAASDLPLAHNVRCLTSGSHPPDQSALLLVAQQLIDDGAWVVVQTSQHNIQAWFWAPWLTSVEESRALARLLCQRYGADPGAANAGHMGRAPGTVNCKPDARSFKASLLLCSGARGWQVESASVSPWLKEFRPRHIRTQDTQLSAGGGLPAGTPATTVETTRARPAPQSPAVLDSISTRARHAIGNQAAAVARQGGVSQDRSKRDWSVAMHACEEARAHGVCDLDTLQNAAADALAICGSDKCRERPDYARDTASKAARMVTNRCGRLASQQGCRMLGGDFPRDVMCPSVRGGTWDMGVLATAIIANCSDSYLEPPDPSASYRPETQFPPWGDDLQSWAEQILRQQGSDRCRVDAGYVAALARQASELWCAGQRTGELMGDWRIAGLIASRYMESDDCRSVEGDTHYEAVDKALSSFGSAYMHSGSEGSRGCSLRGRIARRVVLTTMLGGDCSPGSGPPTTAARPVATPFTGTAGDHPRVPADGTTPRRQAQARQPAHASPVSHSNTAGGTPPDLVAADELPTQPYPEHGGDLDDLTNDGPGAAGAHAAPARAS